MTDVSINTGTTVGMSATLPATFDSIGYGAVGSMTNLGEVIDTGEAAKAYNTIAHQAVTRAYPQKLKDTYDVANITLTLGRFDTDAGQVLLQTALAAAASYTFKILLPSGGITWFTGKVIKAGLGGVATGKVGTTVVEIAVDPESIFEE